MSIFCDLLCLLHHDLNDAAPTRTAEPPYVLQYARVYDSAHLLLSPLVFFNLCPPRLSSAPEKLPLSHELGIAHGDEPHVGYYVGMMVCPRVESVDSSVKSHIAYI